MSKRLGIAAVVIFAVVVSAILFSRANRRSQATRVAIFSIVEIEPIAQLRTGFRTEIEKSEFARAHKVTFIEYNAQGDSALVNQIADKIAADKPRLVYVLGTPAAQALQKRSPDLLIVQGAVTDPVAAGLAADWSGSGRNYIATSDLPPIGKQLELIQALTPNVKRLGVIYNPGEANSVAVLSRLRRVVPNSGISLVEKPIATSADVPLALAAMRGRVDALYLPPDNTAHSAIPTIGRFAVENRVPLYATVQNALDAGALATMSLDFVELGKESADLALQVLSGQDPRSMPIRVNQNPTISVNNRIAKQLGLDTSSAAKLANVKITQ